jgi:ribosomal-protein-alanine N-acetyltransferase
MKFSDLYEVKFIENESFPSPWSMYGFKQELKKEYSFSFVAVSNDHVVGYIMGWYIADEIHIGNIAVHKKFRRQGIGEALMCKAMKKSKKFYWVILEVRYSNIPAKILYRKLGFTEMGIRKNYYEEEGEDAVIMAKYLQSKDQINQKIRKTNNDLV